MQTSKEQKDWSLVKESPCPKAPLFVLKSLAGLAIGLCLLVGALSGCAHRHGAGSSLGPDQALNSLGSRGGSLQSSREKMPDSTAGLKKLPAMTAEDCEAQADMFLKLGKLEKAFVLYDRALRMKPGRVELHNKEAAVYMLKGLYEQALEEFKAVLEKKPDNAEANEGMGLCCFKLKRTEEAAKHFQKAVQIDPKLWLSHNFLGVISDYYKQYEAAVGEYQAAAAIRPSEGFLYNNMGVSYCFMGDYEKAASSFEDALRFGVSGAQVYNNLGLALCKLGRYEEGIEAFKKAGDEAQAYNNVGCIYLEQGNYDAARNAFEKAISCRSSYYGRAVENLKMTEARIQTGETSDALPAVDQMQGTGETLSSPAQPPPPAAKP